MPSTAGTLRNSKLEGCQALCKCCDPRRSPPTCGSGPKGDRTPDLMAASHALYQLSYGPRRGAVYSAAGMGLDLRRSVMTARPMRHPPSGSYDRDAPDAGSALVTGGGG